MVLLSLSLSRWVGAVVLACLQPSIGSLLYLSPADYQVWVWELSLDGFFEVTAAISRPEVARSRSLSDGNISRYHSVGDDGNYTAIKRATLTAP